MLLQKFYMQKCLELAKQGLSHVSPNPMVGCVIVYNNKIIGKGLHEKYGEPHAEVNAIASVKNKNLLKKSTLYVNLEPCCHYGKTPPCTSLIIKHKIPKVVIGCIDSFSKVSGKGIEKMQNAGIKVKLGILENESKLLNKRFFTFNEKKRPYIILKWAKSKDGFIAPNNQKEPFWMTSLESKKLTHLWRAEEDAILIGRITAQKDDPSLTVREIKGKNPIRIVIDKNLKLSRKLKLFNKESDTIIFNAIKSNQYLNKRYIKIKFTELIKSITDELFKLNIQSLIVEGGSKTLQSFINEDFWDEARIFTTKKNLNNGVKTPLINAKLQDKKIIGNDQLEILIND